jgi:hypothetical protein
MSKSMKNYIKKNFMKKLYVLLLLCLCSLNLSAQENLSNSRIIVANGNRYTNTSTVSLELFSLNATHMMISNTPTFAGTSWIKYDREIQVWQLNKTEGTQTVYAKFKDAATGKESEVVKDDIILDQTPPEKCSVKIKTETGFINTKELKVDLKFSAVDAKFMMVSNNNSFYGEKWRIYETEILDWELEKGEDGFRSVFVKFKDNAQNETAIFSDKIVVDRQPPVDCKLTIQKQGTDIYFTKQDRELSITVFARDATEMSIGETQDSASVQWKPYSPNTKYVLTEGDGKKVVYGKFRDAAHNESVWVKDSILLDITAPQDGKITIDGGAETTSHNNKMVTLSIECTDKDVEQMMISNNSLFSGARWTAIVPTVKGWVLDEEQDGVRTVYIKFKDKAGNVSKVFKDDIILKRGIGTEDKTKKITPTTPTTENK